MRDRLGPRPAQSCVCSFWRSWPEPDDRAIEVLATGLPLFFGARLAVDITLWCKLAADGTAHPGAARVDCVVCTRAREDKETKYSELLRGDRCRLVVVALETGGDGARRPFSSWRVWLPSGPGMLHLQCSTPPSWRDGDGGFGCCQCHALVPSPVRWWPCQQRCMPLAEPTCVHLIWQTFLLNRGIFDR